MAILSCHVSIKLPPKISDGQQKRKRLELQNLSSKPCGYESRLAKPDQQPEASLAWRWGDPLCEA